MYLLVKIKIMCSIKIYQSLRLQALIEVTPQKQDLFKKLQEFAVVELKIQVIPVENAIEVAQYIERVVY